MPQTYTPDLKRKLSVSIWKEGRTYTSITAEYELYQKPVSLNGVLDLAKEECQTKAILNPESQMKLS